MTIAIINRPLILLTLSLPGLVSSSFVHADDNITTGSKNAVTPTELETITVVGSPAATPLSPSIQSAREALLKRPGNVSLMPETQYSQQAVFDLSDALSNTPGVYSRSNAGQQSIKLSIRGSGLASPLGVRGLALLRDGLPLNKTDGTIDPAYADPFNTQYLEIYRGANALQYGAATLGGAINLVSPTGYSHPGLETHLAGGSHGYLRAQTRVGEVFENGMDAFASISHYQMDGSTQYSSQKTTRFYGNLGFMPSARSEGRFHVDIAEMDQNIGSPLTLSQLQGHTSLNSPPPQWPNHRVHTHPHVRLAYQHSIHYGNEDFVVLGAHHSDTTFDLLGTVVPINYRAKDYGLSIRGEVNRQFSGRNNRFTWGAHLAQGKSDSQTHGPFILPGGLLIDSSPQQYEDITTSSNTLQFYAENAYELTSALSLVTAVQAVTAKRQRNVDLP